MKNLLILAISIFLFSCGKDGEIGPKGATGVVGADGVNGVNGAVGATGAKGATGDKGATGANGADASGNSVLITFTDWTPYSKFVTDANETVNIGYKSDFNILLLNKLILNPENYRIEFFADFNQFILSDKMTKLPIGTIFYFNSFTDESSKTVVFSDYFDDSKYRLSSSTFGFISLQNSNVVPEFNATMKVGFYKNVYNGGNDFNAEIAKLNTKLRLVFVPANLSAPGGRKKSFESYKEFAKAFNIPSQGSNLAK